MDLILFKTFMKVVAVGNISKAAAILFVTQSAVSRRIKQLEAYAGKPLLFRNGPSLVPTDDGYLLINTARRILDLERDLLNRLGSRKCKEKISFCSTPSLGMDRLPGVLSSFITNHAASVDLNCVFAMPEEALAGIANGRFDLALIDHCDEVDLSSHVTHPLPDGEVLFFSAPALGIDADETTIDRLLGERLYLKDKKGCAKRFIDKNLRNLGRNCEEFSSVVYFDDLSFVISDVLAGNGICFVSKEYVEGKLQEGLLHAHRVVGFNHYRPRTLVLARKELSPLTEVFIEELLNELIVNSPAIDQPLA